MCWVLQSTNDSMNPAGVVPTFTKLRSHKFIGNASTRPRVAPLLSGTRAKFSERQNRRSGPYPATVTTGLFQGYSVRRTVSSDM